MLHTFIHRQQIHDMPMNGIIKYRNANFAAITLYTHILCGILIEWKKHVQIQQHMQIVTHIIQLHMLLLTLAELMKLQQYTWLFIAEVQF